MIYYTHMVERGADHLKALCVVAGALAERAWAMMNRQMPYVICDIDGTPVTAEQAKRIIAQDFTVPDEVRRRRRKTPGRKPAQQAAHGGTTESHEHLKVKGDVDKRGDLPRPRSCAGHHHTVNPKQRARAARTLRGRPPAAR